MIYLMINFNSYVSLQRVTDSETCQAKSAFWWTMFRNFERYGYIMLYNVIYIYSYLDNLDTNIYIYIGFAGVLYI